MPPEAVSGMIAPQKKLQVYSLRALQALSTKKKNDKVPLLSSLKSLVLHSVDFMHLFDFKSCEKSLKEIRFMADHYPLHCSQEKSWKLIPSYIETIQLNMALIKNPGLNPPQFPPFGMVFPDKVHPNLKIVLKIHFYANVFITEQNILTFKEQLLIDIEKQWYMLLKNVPKHVQIINYPQYKNVKLDFMPLHHIMRRNLKAAHRTGLRRHFGRHKINQIYNGDKLGLLVNEQEKFKVVRDREQAEIREKLNGEALAFVADLKVYS
ncbi:unnamed protein product [Ambrosiozyma monospora]|uniref:Unnamed protein product n=1 Tax=Ambrosiozyma monospora TaxID=43982 RepID=A0ACB5TC00_AMBMO|nr:unnamed protein product [Ambrosiozyma monospora]